MVEHVHRRVSTARSVHEVLVATDDERIADAVRAFGGDVRLTRSDHLNGTDRLAEVAETLDCDLVVNVQADEPLIEPSMIDSAVAACANQDNVQMSTLRCQLQGPDDLDDPHVVKVAVDHAGYALFFSRAAIGRDRSGAPPADAVGKHIGLYVYRRDFLVDLSRLPATALEQSERLEQLRVLEYGHRILTTETPHDPIGVDTPADLELVRRLVATGASA